MDKTFRREFTDAQYQEFVWSRLSEKARASVENLMANAAMGLAGECGEVIEHIKKEQFHSKKLNHQEFILELGDVRFYYTCLLIAAGVSDAEVVLGNVQKLEGRKPVVAEAVSSPEARVQNAKAAAMALNIFKVPTT